MGRKPVHPPLRVYLNNQLVGYFRKDPSGAVSFQYDNAWLSRDEALPVSLSLPLREEAYRGAPVATVFDNLLPDSDALRRRVAEKVGAKGTDAYSLLSEIGSDCVGALQFIAGDASEKPVGMIEGEAVDDGAIEAILNNLVQAPLGLKRDDPFRISVAGAQEKTALLFHEGQWLRPYGTTPTTHLFKTQIGQIPGMDVDLSNSVENEFYCLKLLSAFGLPVNDCAIQTFGETKALVIERFDRLWAKDGRLLRLPQEDCCQALSIPPTQKYNSEGGPGIVEILELLSGSDDPASDLHNFLKAQILFWMIGATDGHGKNFSVFLGPGGRFRMTPMYDVLTAQPALVARQIERKQLRLAMAVGDNRHYQLHKVQPRHFLQSATKAGVPKAIMEAVSAEIVAETPKALAAIEAALPADFPENIHDAVQASVTERADMIAKSRN